MNGLATVAAERWLYGTIEAGDLAMPIYSDVVPHDGTYPCVLIQSLEPPTDTEPVYGVRILTRAAYAIRVWGQGSSFAAVSDAYSGLDELIQGGAGSVTEGTVLSCRRSQVLRDRETEDGVSYVGLGGVYDLNITEA